VSPHRLRLKQLKPGPLQAEAALKLAPTSIAATSCMPRPPLSLPAIVIRSRCRLPEFR
jgi:hypothetical protein